MADNEKIRLLWVDDDAEAILYRFSVHLDAQQKFSISYADSFNMARYKLSELTAKAGKPPVLLLEPMLPHTSYSGALDPQLGFEFALRAIRDAAVDTICILSVLNESMMQPNIERLKGAKVKTFDKGQLLDPKVLENIISFLTHQAGTT